MDLSEESVEAALSYGLITDTDANVLIECLKQAGAFAGTPAAYVSGLQQKRRQLQKELRCNRYWQYLDQGGEQPRTAGGRLDWPAKDEWTRINQDLARVKHEEEAAGELFDQLSEHIQVRIELARDLRSTTQSMCKTTTVPLRRLKSPIDQSDVDLCLTWSNSAPGIEASRLIEHLGDYDAKRLLSARVAEVAAADYYRALGASVVDVSVQQLEGHDDRWKDFDLLVDGRPIDVKNARRSFSSSEHYVDHCVPQFKQDRISKLEVSIAGVLSPHASVQTIMGPKYECLMLGEVRRADIQKLAVWLQSRFGHVLQLHGVWKHGYQPGWAFEYPVEHYPDRVATSRTLAHLLNRCVTAGMLPTHIPGWLIALCHNRPQRLMEALTLAKRSILADLESLDVAVGISRPAVFLYVMGAMLESIAARSEANSTGSALTELLFLPGLPRSHSLPLALDDPQAYVAGLLQVLVSIHSRIVATGVEFVGFELTHPSILRGRHADGTFRTLLAYCGGWRSAPARVKCGTAPLHFGQHETCPDCGFLICNNCGHCSKECLSRESRQSRMGILH